MIRHGDLTEDMARFASTWWADQLRGTAHWDNGDNSRTGQTTALLAMTVQSMESRKRSPESVDRFEEILYKKLLEYTSFCVSVDYNPCKILGDALQEAECKGWSSLPIKTQMFFMFDDSIQVSLGYGGSRETILESPDKTGYGFNIFWVMTERRWWHDENE